MRKVVMLVLLGLNGLMQLIGGGMMIVAPDKAAEGFFKIGPTPDIGRTIAVIGGVTLSFLLLTVVTAVLTLRNRREGYSLAVLQGLMLALVGAVMVGTKTSTGAVDIAKGLLLALCGWWAAQVPAIVSGATSAFDRVRGTTTKTGRTLG